MKICLINPRAREVSEICRYSVPHGLLQIHAELKKAGHKIDIIDFSNPLQNSDHTTFNEYDIVGISVMTTQVKHAVAIADSIKTSVKVVWGGVHAFLDPHSILNRYPTHFVVRGEGEWPMVRLARFIENQEPLDHLRNEPGICYFDKEVVVNPPAFIENLEDCADIDYYALPDFEKYLDYYLYWFNKTFRVLPVLTSRFCHWDCSFCINTVYRKFGGLYRRKSFEKIRRETESIIDKLDIEMAMPADEDFFLEWDFVEKWMAYAKEKGFMWGANSRFNYFTSKLLTQDNMKRLVDHNCYRLAMSIEAGNEEIRNKILKKRVTNIMIQRAVETLRASVGDNVAINTSFIVYFPGDTPQNRIETMQMMDDLSRKINVNFSGPQVYRSYPGSPLYDLEQDKKYGEMDYYLKDIDARGTSLAIQNQYEAFFFSFMIRYYFNQRFKYLELITKDKHDIKWKNVKKSRRQSMILQFVFITIRIRLKLNYWQLFVEPTVLGFLFMWTLKNPIVKKLTKSMLNKRMF